ncbi:MAG: hypothetical protein R3C20_12620 [Planctomycetaceae bacterium]
MTEPIGKPDPELDAIRQRVLPALKDDLESWAKRRFWILLVIGALIATSTFWVVLNSAVESVVQKEMASKQAVINAIVGQTESMTGRLIDTTLSDSRKAQEAAAKAEIAAANANESQDLLTKQVNEAIHRSQALNDETKAALDELAQLKTVLSQMKIRQSEVLNQIEKGNELSLQFDKELQNLVIVQEVEVLNDEKSKITLTVDVKPEAKADRERLLAKVERVVYNFDPRWFQDSRKEIVDASARYQQIMTIWGSTMFTAEIVTHDPDRTILRGGMLDTANSKVFELPPYQE